MSFFIAPRHKPQHLDGVDPFKGLASLELIRQSALLLAFFGALGLMFHLSVLGLFRQTAFSITMVETIGALMQPALLPVWLVACLLGLSTAVVCSSLSGRLAAKRGGTFLSRLREIPAEHSLITLLDQMQEAHVLAQPVFKVGGTDIPFDLAVVSVHGVSLFRSANANGNDAGVLQTTLTRLSEQYGLPLLARVRYFLLTSSAEVKLEQGWQGCSMGDVGRHFQRTEAIVGAQELAKCFRILYGLALPAEMPPVLLEGSIPANFKASIKKSKHAVNGHKGVERMVKLLLFALLSLSLAAGVIYLLQLFQYETAEKILHPMRIFLRAVLPQDWHDRLALGTEIDVDEIHIYATAVGDNPVKLSAALGRSADGPEIPSGIQLQVIQAKEHGTESWFLVSTLKASGWLPGNALRMRHTVFAGSLLYDRPDMNAKKTISIPHDSPVAVLKVWHRPLGDTIVTWSKVSFLDKSIGYVQGDI